MTEVELQNTFSDSKFEEIMNLKSSIEVVLKLSPASRNSDDVLFDALCSLYPKHRFKYESVARCRRKFQEAGRYLPTDPEIVKKRRQACDIMRASMKQVRF